MPNRVLYQTGLNHTRLRSRSNLKIKGSEIEPKDKVKYLEDLDRGKHGKFNFAEY